MFVDILGFAFFFLGALAGLLILLTYKLGRRFRHKDEHLRDWG